MALATDAAPGVDAIAPLPGTDFYYATLYLPATARRTAHVLEACRREIRRVPQTCSDRGVAHIKLAWWREELERLDHGRPRHPLSHALAPLVRTQPELLGIYRDLVARTAAELGGGAPPTREAVRHTVHATHAAWLEAFARALADRAPHPGVVPLGCLTELAQELMRLREHRRDGTLYLARDALARHGLDVDALRAVRDSARLRELLEAEFAALEAELDTAIAALGRGARRRHHAQTTLARIARHALALTRADGCAVLERRVELLPIHKLWLAWRSRRLG